MQRLPEGFKEYVISTTNFAFYGNIQTFQKASCQHKLQSLLRYINDDISSASEFSKEIQFLKSIHNANLAEPKKPGEIVKPLGPLAILNKLHTLNLQNLFPNISIALRIFLTLPVGVATDSRKILQQTKTDKKKLLEIHHWTRKTICSLATLSIESDIAEQSDYESVIDAFAETKARKHF